jgi:hypothetical protein
MIKIEKRYWVLAILSVLQIVFLVSSNYISNIHFTLSEKEIKELDILARNNNLTAVARLANYYYFIENDSNATANVYRKYKNVNPKIEEALCIFLTTRRDLRQEGECYEYFKRNR